MASTHDRNDPFTLFNFILDIEGMKAGFAEIKGLSTEAGVIEERNDKIAERKLRGIRKFTNLTLKRGYTNSEELQNWLKGVIEGSIRRLSGTITLVDDRRNRAAAWKFDEGWPTKLEGPAFNGQGNDVAIETLELTVEGLTLEYPPAR